MKAKRRTICQTCRKGKISCDGKRPACSQCSFRNLNCPGYPTDWVFVPHSTHGARVRARRGEARTGAGAKSHPAPEEFGAQSTRPANSPATLSLSELVTAIIHHYVPDSAAAALSNSVEPSPRICGSWVEVLPQLVVHEADPALASAIRAFAVTILSRGPQKALPVFEGLEAYNQALISVNLALQSPYSDFPVAIAAAVMCLLLAELFHATALRSWTAHLQGLAELMQLSRPEVYASGIPHRLFVGARPALVVLAFLSRRSSFLADGQWKTVPFRETAPSPVQELMSEAAVMPSILERMDAEGASAVADEAIEAFETVIDRLDAWEHEFQSSSAASSPSFWFQPSASGREHIWFRDITAASALTHLWAFKVICLRNIGQLSAVCSQSEGRNGIDAARLDESKRLSVMICQSIEYLMQDGMKLFGPTSAILPLRTAYETFQTGGRQTWEELSWCTRILESIQTRGYAFMSFFIEHEVGKSQNAAEI